MVVPSGGDKKIKVKALLNPLLYKNKLYIGGGYMPDGFFDGGHYLYVGLPDVRLDNLPIGSVIFCSGSKYVIKRGEQYFLGGSPIYTWAVLQLAERDDDNGKST